MAQILNKTVTYAALAALLTLIAAPLRPMNAQTVPAPDREQLLNGLTILYGNRAGDPNVLLKLRIKSGAAFDLAGKAGTMSLLADAMFPESTTREYVADQLGGRLDVTTTYDSIDVTISGKSSELERMIDLVRNATLSVNLSPESVATLRDTRLKQLAEKVAASELADQAVAARLFGSYPYGSPPNGTSATVAKIERADLMLARERFLNAENATLAVIGGVEKPRLMRALRQLLGPWQKGDRLVPATFRQPGAVDDRVLLIDDPRTTNVQIRLAVRALPRADSDTFVEVPLAQLAVTRWRAAVPELSNTSYVRVEPHLLSGTFTFAATVPAAAAAKAITAAKKVMADLSSASPAAAEMPGVIDMSSRAMEPELTATAWLDSDYYRAQPVSANDVSRIRPDDMRRVAVRLFGNSAPMAIVVVGNASELQTQLGYKIELRANTPPAMPATTPVSPLKKP